MQREGQCRSDQKIVMQRGVMSSLTKQTVRSTKVSVSGYQKIMVPVSPVSPAQDGDAA